MPLLRLALPKGRVLDESVALFAKAGVDLSVVKDGSRRLVFDAPEARVFVVRDADVPTYVERGAADLGIVGGDVLDEQGHDLYEPLDLGIGRCRLSVAEPMDGVRVSDELPLRYATKFPNLTRRYLEDRGLFAEVIKLSGSIELGPLTGLSDRIVDLVSSGETLRQNRLREIEVIMEVSARLVVNRATFRLRRQAIDSLLSRLRRVV